MAWARLKAGVLYIKARMSNAIKAITKQQVGEFTGTIQQRKQDRLRDYLTKAAPRICVRLAKVAQGKEDMTPTQFQAAALIMRKVLPDAVPDSNNMGQSLASILADIARSLPPNTQVGIAINNQHNQQVTQGTGLDIDPVEGKG